MKKVIGTTLVLSIILITYSCQKEEITPLVEQTTENGYNNTPTEDSYLPQGPIGTPSYPPSGPLSPNFIPESDFSAETVSELTDFTKPLVPSDFPETYPTNESAQKLSASSLLPWHPVSITWSDKPPKVSSY